MHGLDVKKKFQISVKDVKMEFLYVKVGRRGAHGDTSRFLVGRILASLEKLEVEKKREEKGKKR